MLKQNALIAFFSLFSFFCICSAQPLHEQDSTNKKADFVALIKILKTEQKLILLDYMLDTENPNYDLMMSRMFETLSTTEQDKTMELLKSMRGGDNSSIEANVLFNKTTFDFGMIEEGTTWFDSVEVKNIGQTAYKISEIETDCDCLILNHTKKPLPAGEKRILRFEFNSTGKNGSMNGKGLIVRDNTKNKRNILEVKGIVVPKGIIKKTP